MPYLSPEPVQSLSPNQRSPFAESIILASVCRHLAVHQQCSVTDGIQGKVLQPFWDRHKMLDEMLRARADLILLNYPVSLHISDPMLLFTSTMIHALVLCLGNTMDSMRLETQEYQNAVAASRQRSLLAARNILNLTKSLGQLSYLKVSFCPFSMRSRISDSPFCRYTRLRHSRSEYALITSTHTTIEMNS